MQSRKNLTGAEQALSARPTPSPLPQPRQAPLAMFLAARVQGGVQGSSPAPGLRCTRTHAPAGRPGVPQSRASVPGWPPPRATWPAPPSTHAAPRRRATRTAPPAQRAPWSVLVCVWVWGGRAGREAGDCVGRWADRKTPAADRAKMSKGVGRVRRGPDCAGHQHTHWEVTEPLCAVWSASPHAPAHVLQLPTDARPPPGRLQHHS